jgi:SusD family.
MWMQTMAGTDRQFIPFGTYTVSESDYDGEFTRAYRPSLLDLRQIQAQSRESGDQVFLGVAQVAEAMFMTPVADIWGDVPYSQAAKPDSFPTPVYDPQQDVYAALQALLDEAIVNLAGSGAGPGKADLVYGGDADKWIELAHTLKARLYLHVAEVDPSAYQKALDEANLGISSNDGDYVIPYTATNSEDNNWYQFMVVQRAGYISTGKYLIDLLARNDAIVSNDDPRLTEYFVKGDTTIIMGAAPGEGISGVFAALNPAAGHRGAQDYQQALVTYNENLLIKAEALQHVGPAAPALAALNEELDAWATATPWHSAVTLASANPLLTGNALLQAIMQEKYITLFQNIESWNDYKRTCIPALNPASGKPEIPGRLPYATSELQTNPNTPTTNPARNWNDPNACT